MKKKWNNEKIELIWKFKYLKNSKTDEIRTAL